MANPEHVEVLKKGIAAWNVWREQYPNIRPKLDGIDLEGQHLRNANFKLVDFSGAILRESRCYKADFTGADLSDANLEWVLLSHTKLITSILRRANLEKSNLRWADATGADFTGSQLRYASLVGTVLQDAIVSGCSVYGISAWNLKGTPQKQNELVITRKKESVITVDKLEVAQFIYLLLNNQNIRHVIDTITSKVVLILGRFTPERKAVLDAIRDELRKRDYTPVLFGFEKHMARFVIADITDAKSIPQELMAIVPALPSVPVQPLLLASQREYGMFEHFKRYPWVLEPYLYEDQDRLLAAITDKVIGPAEVKTREQTGR
jgi:uncharacterized protein YjbI with pentapeptide repeats